MLEEESPSDVVALGRFPSWLHRNLPRGGGLKMTKDVLGEARLPTVCEEARCPNITDCWSRKTATFLVMGKECTRACGFCDIAHAKEPKPLEADEPERVADSVLKLGLKFVVLTMVARDDLPDQGLAHLIKIMEKIREKAPGVPIEVLTSDFFGNESLLAILAAARPDVFNHNLETVRSLTPKVRHTATYDRSLAVLKVMRKLCPTAKIKSGMMLGLGETEAEVFTAIDDLKAAGVDAITMGQYLQASKNNLRVKAFVHPDTFKKYEEYGLACGIRKMYCGPFVRSSFNADLLEAELSQQ